MQKIRFIYKSYEVIPNIFLSLYFRMIGIYVCEQYFDFSKEKTARLLSYLVEEKDESEETENIVDRDFIFELYYIGDEEDAYEYEKNYRDFNSELPRIVIVNDEEEELFSFLNSENECVIRYRKANVLTSADNLQMLLNEIVEKAKEIGSIDEKIEEDWKNCAKVYAEYNVWRVLLLGKYFYAAENREQYSEVIEGYDAVIDKIFEILSAKHCNWGDEDYIHLQYSVLNMAYEGNLYCVRNSASMLYSSKSIGDICKTLLKNGASNGMEANFSLLLAQIYDDLMGDHNVAYQFHLEACQKYNSAYAFYRKGKYWQDYAKDYKKAIRYYIKGVKIYPEYYRAWYRLGRCYMLSERYHDALNMFRNVTEILKSRLEKKQLRPIEIEYIFKAYNLCGYICNKKLNNPRLAILENMQAEDAWEAIGKSEFFEIFSNDKEVIRERVQRKLNISKIYKVICNLADKIEDRNLKEVYLLKLGT